MSLSALLTPRLRCHAGSNSSAPHLPPPGDPCSKFPFRFEVKDEVHWFCQLQMQAPNSPPKLTYSRPLIVVWIIFQGLFSGSRRASAYLYNARSGLWGRCPYAYPALHAWWSTRFYCWRYYKTAAWLLDFIDRKEPSQDLNWIRNRNDDLIDGGFDWKARLICNKENWKPR